MLHHLKVSKKKKSEAPYLIDQPAVQRGGNLEELPCLAGNQSPDLRRGCAGEGSGQPFFFQNLLTVK